MTPTPDGRFLRRVGDGNQEGFTFASASRRNHLAISRVAPGGSRAGALSTPNSKESPITHLARTSDEAVGHPVAPSEPSEPALPRSERRTRNLRRTVACAFAAAVLVVADPGKNPLGTAGVLAGLAVAVLGEVLRIWACGHLRKNEDVISSGPYARVRNPLYLGTLLILVGFCVAAGSRVVLEGLLPVGLLAFALYYAPKKERIESARLRERFGAKFDEWHASVPAYLPRLTRWPPASRAPWSGRLVVENTEVETALFVTVGVAVMLARWFA